MSVKDQLYGVAETAMNISHKQFDRLFALILLTFVIVLLVDTPQYSDRGQLFPLIIGVPTLLLLLAVLGTLVSSRMGRLASRYAGADLFEIDEINKVVGEEKASDSEETTMGGGETRSLQRERFDVLQISLWVLVYFVTIVLIGFLPATLVFLLAYYRIHAEQSIPRTILFSLLMWAFIIVIFDVVLNTPFYTGVFGVELPLPT